MAERSSVTAALDRFASLGAIMQAPATSDEVDAFEARVRLRIPAALRALFLRCNGLVLDEPSTKLLSLDEAASLRETMTGHGRPDWKYVPITDRDDSDSFCVVCEGALEGFVLDVRHDGVSGLAYRSLASLLDALVEQVAATRREDDYVELPLELESDLARTPDDVERGRGLLAHGLAISPDDGHREIERRDAIRFALTLFPSSEAQVVADLAFSEPDKWVREDVLAWLRDNPTPIAEAALARYEAERTRFRAACRRALEADGVVVLEEKPDVLRIDGMGWLDLESFFGGRSAPDVLQRVVSRVHALRKAHAQRSGR